MSGKAKKTSSKPSLADAEFDSSEDEDSRMGRLEIENRLLGQKVGPMLADGINKFNRIFS